MNETLSIRLTISKLQVNNFSIYSDVMTFAPTLKKYISTDLTIHFPQLDHHHVEIRAQQMRVEHFMGLVHICTYNMALFVLILFGTRARSVQRIHHSPLLFYTQNQPIIAQTFTKLLLVVIAVQSVAYLVTGSLVAIDRCISEICHPVPVC